MNGYRLALVMAGAFGLSTLLPASSPAQEPSSRTFTVKGVKLHYLIEGKGEPVLLIHGLFSSADINWKKTRVVDELAREHLVIALDLPGHGQSDKPETEDAYGLQIVEDMVLLLDHLKIKKAHMVGYSLGGIVVGKFISLHPERTLSGTLGGMGWFKEGSPQEKMFEKIKGGDKVPAACMQSVGKLSLTEAELRKIQPPVKIVVGERDPCKMMYVNPLGKVRPDWPVVEIVGAGHLNCITKKEFRDEIATWLRQRTKP